MIESSSFPSQLKRLFYGLKKNGRYYFPGEPVYKEINLTNCVDWGNTKYRGRFESRNLLVSLKDDIDKEKQYLFSMSSFYSVSELIDIDDVENLTYFILDTIKFFDINRKIFSYEYSLFEIENSNTSISAFIESAGETGGNEYSNTVTIKKFQFKSFNSNDMKKYSTHNILWD